MAIITFHKNSVNTSGNLPSIGCTAPHFTLTNSKLNEVTLDAFAGKKKILNIVPSLDTPTCAASTRKFNEKAGHLYNTVVLIISADLPFAQCRFCEIEDLRNVIALSTFRSTFAEDYGIKLVDSILAGLTARAIVVIDEHDKIIYTELVSELANEPNYEAVLAILH